MANELVTSMIELLGTIGIAIRASKNRPEPTLVSLPVACMFFLFFGFIISLFIIGLLKLTSLAITTLLVSALFALVIITAKHMGHKAGFMLSWKLSALYAFFYYFSFLSVLYVSNSL